MSACRADGSDYGRRQRFPLSATWLRALVVTVAVFAVAVTMLSTALVEPSEAQTLRDDFTSPGFSTDIWYPCFRDENVLSVGAANGLARPIVVTTRRNGRNSGRPTANT